MQLRCEGTATPYLEEASMTPPAQHRGCSTSPVGTASPELESWLGYALKRCKALLQVPRAPGRGDSREIQMPSPPGCPCMGCSKLCQQFCQGALLLLLGLTLGKGKTPPDPKVASKTALDTAQASWLAGRPAALAQMGLGCKLPTASSFSSAAAAQARDGTRKAQGHQGARAVPGKVGAHVPLAR